jgi:hypothetical protein
VLAGTDAADPWFAAMVAGTFAAVLIAAFARFSASSVRA